MLDADGAEVRVGNCVKVLAAAGTKYEYESYIIRKVLAFDGDNLILEWYGGSQKWPAKWCRVVK